MYGYTRWRWKAQDYSSCIVLYPLQVWCHIMSGTKQQWVTVVNSWQNKSRYKCGSCSTCQESTNRSVVWDAVKPDARLRTRSRLETCQTMLVEYGNQGGDGWRALNMCLCLFSEGTHSAFCICTVIRYWHIPCAWSIWYDLLNLL